MVRFAAAIFACGAGLFGCNLWLGADEFIVTDLCEYPGERRCGEGNRPEECDTEGRWKKLTACVDQTCIGGECVGECAPGEKGCSGNTRKTCDAGLWKNVTEGPCTGQTCNNGECVGMCEPDQKKCSGNALSACDATGVWSDGEPCTGKTCNKDKCVGMCESGQKKCLGDNNILSECDATGTWANGGYCTGQTCIEDACEGVCEPGEKKCSGNTRQTCDANGDWESPTVCEVECVNDACVGPSCKDLTIKCGMRANENCCLSSMVPQGTYKRSNASDATVSEFRLDRFEITVGRFRKFVDAYPGNTTAVSAGAGAHPTIAGSGWDPSWNIYLPADQALLKAELKSVQSPTWTDAPAGNEQKPINGITWYEAFAFCAWDGGRLPTEAEWNYAAAGGAEQRLFPWSTPPVSLLIDAEYAVYDCFGDKSVGCATSDILPVGSKSGDGKWNHADLAGSVWEWNLDAYGPYTTPCMDCANVSTLPSDRVIRGGSWKDPETNLYSFGRFKSAPNARQSVHGARCARTP
jgi:formylglycine-generating enzyme required for sulfatase activity